MHLFKQKSDIRFMQRALTHAKTLVNQGQFPVACILVYKGRVIADSSPLKTKSRYSDDTDHAEIIAIRKIRKRIVGNRLTSKDITCYVTLEPCLMCYGALLIAGIGRIVWAYEDVLGGGTQCDLTKLPPLYKEARPEIAGHVLRNDSLQLFKRFWDDSKNTYLRGTLLHTYTMSQTEQRGAL